MANDVTIVVEASLGDTLLKLELAKVALNDLEDAGGSAGATIGDDTNRNSLSSRLGNFQKRLGNMGDRGPLGKVIRGFGNLAAAMIEPIALGAKFAENFQSIGTIGQSLVGVVASLTLGFAGLSAIIVVVTFTATALADILGTLVAIVADFVAPLTLVVGLLGSLGIGFAIAAKRAADGGGKLTVFSKELDKLKSMFGRTSDILAHVFLPYLMELAHAGERALFFLDKIAKLPLKQAFQEISTQGVQLLTKFVNRVAEVTAKPIRLAFKLAFGTGPSGNEFASVVSSWWTRFTNFLFGYVERHPMTKLDILKGSKPTQHTVEGIFQPLIDWFNRHHFTRQGIQIGREILNGVLNSGMRHRLADFIGDIFKDAMKQAAGTVLHARAWPLMKYLAGLAWDWIKNKAGGILNVISGWIKGKLSDAWNSIKTTIGNIWDWIVQKIETPFHISIDWPSPPAWLTNWLGGGAGGSGGPIHPGPSPHPTSGGGTGHPGFRPSVAMAAPPMVVVHVHGADLSDAPTRRRIGQQIGKEIASDWRRRAGGH